MLMIDLGQAGRQKAFRYRPDDAPEDPTEAFRSQIASFGLSVDEIDVSGALVRLDMQKRGDKAGWYVFYGAEDGDVCAGAFGDWRSGLKETWCSKASKDFSDEEAKARQRRQKKAPGRGSKAPSRSPCPRKRNLDPVRARQAGPSLPGEKACSGTRTA